MRRNICKALAILMAFALVMSLAAVSALAYDAINGGQTSFSKYLVADDDAQIPDVHFDFTIEAGTPVAGGDGNALEILAGPVVIDETTNEVTAPTIAPAQFSSGMPTTDGLPTDEEGSVTDGKVYAESNIAIDLTGVTFTVPGVYRYVITEQPNEFNGITNDSTAVRYLDVFVFPSESNPDVLEVQNYALRTAATSFERVYDSEAGIYKYQYVTNPGKKSDHYTNELETVDLEFSKKITGNQADMTKKFRFQLDLDNVNPGDYTLEITGTDVIRDDSNVTADNGVYTIHVDASGSYTGYFYLTNAEKVKVISLNKGYSYEVQEEAQDYTPTEGIDNDGTENDYTDPYTGTGITSPIVKTGYTNTREGAIPTGVIITIAPFAIGLLLFGAIMLYMVSRRRRATY
ncbi:MAG: hypothetical protein IJK40_10415 [Clostridia bacterium]|nr:hypothetical protein [Clostridia bacterium]